MLHRRTIGVGGAMGELGSPLASEIARRGIPAVGYDIKKDGYRNPDVHWVSTREELVDCCSDIHWCGDINGALSIYDLSAEKSLVFHDSVMHNSALAAEVIRTRPGVLGRIGIAHILMRKSSKNDRTIVAIDPELSDEPDRLAADFRLIGLEPTFITAREHDQVHAETTSITALEIVSGALVRVRPYVEAEQTAPSAKVRVDAWEHREDRWTDLTTASLGSNPYLIPALERLIAAAEEGTDLAHNDVQQLTLL